MTAYSEFHSVHLIPDFFPQPIFLAEYFQPFHHKPQAVRRMSNLFWNHNLSLKFDSCFFSPAHTFFISVILRVILLCASANPAQPCANNVMRGGKEGKAAILQDRHSYFQCL